MSEVANLKAWVIEQAGGEPIEGVVIGEGGWDREREDVAPEDRQNIVLTWEEAAPLLDHGFDDGFGSTGCPAITAWTASWVIFVGIYDGATFPERVPRHPVNHEPAMPGGG